MQGIRRAGGQAWSLRRALPFPIRFPSVVEAPARTDVHVDGVSLSFVEVLLNCGPDVPPLGLGAWSEGHGRFGLEWHHFSELA